MSKESRINYDGWISYGTWPEGWCDGDVELPDDRRGPPVEDMRISIPDAPYERLGRWKALQFGVGMMPKGWGQWIVFLWGMDIWFGKWPLCKSLVAANLLMWAWLIMVKG